MHLMSLLCVYFHCLLSTASQKDCSECHFNPPSRTHTHRLVPPLELVLLEAPSGAVKWVLSETDGGQDPHTHTDTHRHTYTHPHMCTVLCYAFQTCTGAPMYTHTHTHQSLYPEAVHCQTPHPELQLCQLYTPTCTLSEFMLSLCVYLCMHILVSVYFCMCVCVCVCIYVIVSMFCKLMYVNLSA